MARLFFIIAAFVVAASGADAQIFGARPIAPPKAQPPARLRPPKPAAWAPLPVAFSERVVLWDGMNLRKQVMTFAPGVAVEMNFNVLDDWRREDSPGSSASWLRKYDPVRLTVSAFRPAAANILLQTEAWSTFTPYLRDARAESLSVLCDDDSQTNPQMLRLMGWRTRVYECEFSVPGPANQRIRQTVTACSDGSTAYVFTFEGPPRAMLSSYAEFERILLSLDPLRK